MDTHLVTNFVHTATVYMLVEDMLSFSSRQYLLTDVP